jgi:DNA recombination protein RmuC
LLRARVCGFHQIARRPRTERSNKKPIRLSRTTNSWKVSRANRPTVPSPAHHGDSEAVQAASEALGRAVRAAAKDIHDKYVNPPNTTDFAILFLATEGLYAELLRQPALVEDLQQRYRIVLSGPTTLVALLSSLRMGFRTLAIEQQASEVWRVLGAVKTEFGKFGDALDKVGRQLDSASKTIVNTGVWTRAIQRSLRTVEQLPQGEASTVLGLPGTLLAADDANDIADEEHLEA